MVWLNWKNILFILVLTREEAPCNIKEQNCFAVSLIFMILYIRQVDRDAGIQVHLWQMIFEDI